MSPQEFEAKNIGNFDSYHELMEAYTKLKLREQAESMYTSEEVKEILIRFKSDVITNHQAQITNLNPYQWFKQFEKEGVLYVRLGLFTEDQMYLFAGYCMGKRMQDPTRDVTEIMEEWKEDFKISQNV